MEDRPCTNEYTQMDDMCSCCSDTVCSCCSSESSDRDDELDDDNGIPPPPDGGWGWVIMVVSFLNNMVVDGVAYSFGVFLGELSEHFGVGRRDTAWIGSVVPGCYLMIGPVVSALCNKFGVRAVTICGSFISGLAFFLSTFSPSVGVMIALYGVVGGIGFGCIYLPAVVAVGYYFESKRSTATGIAVCGSGVGTFIFAPFSKWLLDIYGWRGAIMILGGIVLNCAVFGSLMRPLKAPKRKSRRDFHEEDMDNNVSGTLKRQSKHKEELIRRFTVHDGDNASLERGLRPAYSEYAYQASPYEPVEEKIPEVEELAEGEELEEAVGGGEGGDIEDKNSADSGFRSSNESAVDDQNQIVLQNKDHSKEAEVFPDKEHIEVQEKLDLLETEERVEKKKESSLRKARTSALQRVKARRAQSIEEEDEVEEISNIPVRTAKSMEKISSNGDIREENAEGEELISQDCLVLSDIWKPKTSKNQKKKKKLKKSENNWKNRQNDYARPMYRKDIFFSGSIFHLNEYKSQGSMLNYRASVHQIPQAIPPNKSEAVATRLLRKCLPDSMLDPLKEMMDFSLMKNPYFLMICISNIFGMIGFYVPFVYITDRAITIGVEKTIAAYLISIIGITNTFGRVFFGWFTDKPKVNSLFVNNVTLIISGVTTGLSIFCTNYLSLAIYAGLFGLCVSAYISLTSMILVDLFGVESLTNSFGLLTCFRGLSSMIGPPIAGSMIDATESHEMSFLMSGCFLVSAGLVSSAVSVMQWRRQRREKRENGGEANDDSTSVNNYEEIYEVHQQVSVV